MIIKAIPTRYEGVNFRSRLEARWAAFFDLNGWAWDYEPVDLAGWAPDFKIETPLCPVYVEVKPADADDGALRNPIFNKAVNHWDHVQVMLLGLAPRGVPHAGIGFLCDAPTHASYAWADLNDFFRVSGSFGSWRKAGNRVQWKGHKGRKPSSFRMGASR